MLFSERMGYKKIDQELLKKEVPEHLRNRIWNVFSLNVFNRTVSSEKIRFCGVLLDKFFKQDLDKYIECLDSVTLSYIYPDIKKLFYKLSWDKIYDFIEYFALNYPASEYDTFDYVIDELNGVLEDERVPYRILNGLVAPLITDDEIAEVNTALSLPYKNVTAHLNKALAYLSDKKQPDYPNSIKESISALESLAAELLGKKGTLGELIKQLDVHPALGNGFGNLYGWTSDDGGIRHGRHREALDPGLPEARYMVVITSAFINFLVAKFTEKGKNV